MHDPSSVSGPRRGGAPGRARRFAPLLALLFCAGPALARDGRGLHLVALGDSLTAGYGIGAGNAFPAVLERTLRARGYDVSVTNAGVNGDTAGGGYARLDGAVPAGTDGVILELGGNDMLQGLDPARTRDALAGIVARLRGRGIPVLLAGMRALPQRGPAYVARFEAIYPELARGYGLSYYPFFLRNVVFVPGLTLADGIHPTPAGVQRIVGQMLPSVIRLLGRVGGRPRA